jgi:hypothetical protein
LVVVSSLEVLHLNNRLWFGFGALQTPK